MSLNETNNKAVDDWEGFYEELQNETPRAAVLIAASFLDEWLRRLLQAKMIDDSKAVKALLDDSNNGPLSFFSARINAAYCLGLLSKDERDDLNLIRKIRNRFAHRLHGFTFDEQEIKDWCMSLALPHSIVSALPDFPKDHRSRFLLGVSLLASRLSLRTISETDRLSPASRPTKTSISLEKRPCGTVGSKQEPS